MTHRITKNGVGYEQYESGTRCPDTVGTDWVENERVEEVMADSGVGNDDEIWQGRLVEAWRGNPAGSLVIGGLPADGHLFVVVPSL